MSSSFVVRRAAGKGSRPLKRGDLVEVDQVDSRLGWRSPELRSVMGKVGTVLRVPTEESLAKGWPIGAIEVFFTKPLRTMILHESELTLARP